MFLLEVDIYNSACSNTPVPELENADVSPVTPPLVSRGVVMTEMGGSGVERAASGQYR